MSLEEELRNAAAKGMTHVTLHTTWSDDRKTVYWTARATPSTGHSYVQTNSLDPVTAMSEVLKALPKAKKRVTAAVTGDEAPRIDTNRGKKYKEPEQEELDNWLPKA